jgi:L-threonylcarbamoyladenylate synthase
MPLILKVDGGVLAFPTETFYGLAALATDREAVERVYLLKRRAVDKSLSILIADLVELQNWVEVIPPEAHHLMARFWPGPLTLPLLLLVPIGQGRRAAAAALRSWPS